MRPGLRAILASNQYCAAAKTLFAAMNNVPTVQRAIIIDATIRSLQSAGIWSQLDVLYILAAADSQAALLNWVNPGVFTAIPVNSPTFVVDRGYTGDGATSRLRTQYTPSVNGVQFTQNNASMFVWSNTNVAQAAQDMGNISATINDRLATRAVGDLVTSRLNSATTGAASNASSLGLIGTSRASSTIQNFWRNGVNISGNLSATTTGLCGGELWICGANSGIYSTKQLAAAVIGGSLLNLQPSLYGSILSYIKNVGVA